MVISCIQRACSSSVLGVISYYVGTWYNRATRLDILYGTNAVWDDMGYFGGMVYGNMGKTPYVVPGYDRCRRHGTGKTQYMVW